MKRLIFSKFGKLSFLALGLAVIAVILTLAVTNSKITASLKAPKIVFKEDVHDFGKVERGPELQYNFKFTNKGNAPLIIERVQTSCGCTGATVGEKTEYKKGESGEIRVTFQTQGRSGQQEKSIVVFSNDPETPQKELKVRCFVIDPK